MRDVQMVAMATRRPDTSRSRAAQDNDCARPVGRISRLRQTHRGPLRRDDFHVCREKERHAVGVVDGFTEEGSEARGRLRQVERVRAFLGGRRMRFPFRVAEVARGGGCRPDADFAWSEVRLDPERHISVGVGVLKRELRKRFSFASLTMQGIQRPGDACRIVQA